MKNKKPLIINIGFTSEETETINKKIKEGIRTLRKRSGLSEDVINAIEMAESEGQDERF